MQVPLNHSREFAYNWRELHIIREWNKEMTQLDLCTLKNGFGYYAMNGWENEKGERIGSKESSQEVIADILAKDKSNNGGENGKQSKGECILMVRLTGRANGSIIPVIDCCHQSLCWASCEVLSPGHTIQFLHQACELGNIVPIVQIGKLR